jgi:hypothetical protein
MADDTNKVIDAAFIWRNERAIDRTPPHRRQRGERCLLWR